MPLLHSSTPLQKVKKEFVSACPPGWKLDATLNETRTALGRSFCGNQQVDGEPVVTWIVGSTFDKKISKGTFDNSKERLYTFVISLVVNPAIQDGALVLVKQSSDPSFGVTALLVEHTDATNRCGCFPQLREHLDWVFLRIRLDTTVPAQTIRQIKVRYNHMMHLLHRWHSQYTTGAHWFVTLIGTDPECQGQGLGSAMMRKINEMADSHEMDVYLECGDERNRSYYRKFGYNVSGDHEVTDPTGCEPPIRVYCMLRKFIKRDSVKLDNT